MSAIEPSSEDSLFVQIVGFEEEKQNKTKQNKNTFLHTSPAYEKGQADKHVFWEGSLFTDPASHFREDKIRFVWHVFSKKKKTKKKTKQTNKRNK